jgi:hypothetical protein
MSFRKIISETWMQMYLIMLRFKYQVSKPQNILENLSPVLKRVIVDVTKLHVSRSWKDFTPPAPQNHPTALLEVNSTELVTSLRCNFWAVFTRLESAARAAALRCDNESWDSVAGTTARRFIYSGPLTYKPSEGKRTTACNQQTTTTPYV